MCVRCCVLSFLDPSAQVSSATGVTALVQLDYFFDAGRSTSVQMKSLVHVSQSFGAGASKFYVDGKVKLLQSNPIREGLSRNIYDQVLFNNLTSSTLAPGAAVDLDVILASYLDRNETTALLPQHHSWKTAQGAGSGAPFTTHLRIRIPPDTLMIKRNRAQVFKLGFVQVITVLVVFRFFYQFVDRTVFRARLFGTRVVSDVRKEKPF